MESNLTNAVTLLGLVLGGLRFAYWCAKDHKQTDDALAALKAQLMAEQARAEAAPPPPPAPVIRRTSCAAAWGGAALVAASSASAATPPGPPPPAVGSSPEPVTPAEPITAASDAGAGGLGDLAGGVLEFLAAIVVAVLSG